MNSRPRFLARGFLLGRELLLLLALDDLVEALLLGNGRIDLLGNRLQLVAVGLLHVGQNVDDDGVVAVHGDREVVGHLAVELAHAAASHGRHLLHTAHELILRDDHGRLVGRHGLERDVVVNLLVLATGPGYKSSGETM